MAGDEAISLEQTCLFLEDNGTIIWQGKNDLDGSTHSTYYDGGNREL